MKGYLLRDEIRIFHLAAWDLKFYQMFGSNWHLKSVVYYGRWQKMSDTSITSSLSLAWGRWWLRFHERNTCNSISRDKHTNWQFDTPWNVQQIVENEMKKLLRFLFPIQQAIKSTPLYLLSIEAGILSFGGMCESEKGNWKISPNFPTASHFLYFLFYAFEHIFWVV